MLPYYICLWISGNIQFADTQQIHVEIISLGGFAGMQINNCLQNYLKVLSINLI